MVSSERSLQGRHSRMGVTTRIHYVGRARRPEARDRAVCIWLRGERQRIFFNPHATVGNLRVSQTECPSGSATRITNIAGLSCTSVDNSLWNTCAFHIVGRDPFSRQFEPRLANQLAASDPERVSWIARFVANSSRSATWAHGRSTRLM
jgi:hypothetical protein